MGTDHYAATLIADLEKRFATIGELFKSMMLNGTKTTEAIGVLRALPLQRGAQRARWTFIAISSNLR